MMLESEQVDKLNTAYTYLIVATQETTQATVEFAETLKAIKSRYHPLVWWLMSWLQTLRV